MTILSANLVASPVGRVKARIVESLSGGLMTSASERTAWSERSGDGSMSQINHYLSVPLRWLLTGRDKEEGQGLVEYSMILSLVAVVAVTALTGFGAKVASLISGMSGAL